MTPPAVVRMLVERELLKTAEILDGGIVVEDLRGLGTSFRVRLGDGRTLIVKTAARGSEDWQRREATTLAALVREPDIAGVLPAVAAIDTDAGTLVMGAAPAARTLRDVAERGAISAELAAALGDALARLHRLPLTTAAAAASRAPWQLALAEPDLALYQLASHAGLALVETIQAHPSFVRALDELRGAWRPTALVHHDLRWDNVIVSGGTADAPATITLIDWEHARPGDPAWDLGCVFGEFLNGWLDALGPPAAGANAPASEQVLAAMRPAIRACWASYAAGSGLAGAPAAAVLGRATRYAAVWVAGSRFERLRTQAALGEPDRRALQLALNVLERPGEAAIAILGIGSPADRDRA